MSKVAKSGLLFIGLGLTLLQSLNQAKGETEIPQLGDGILVLEINDTYMTNPVISASGEYLFVTSNSIDANIRAQGYSVYSAMMEGNSYVWRIYESAFGNDVIYPLPNWALPLKDSIIGPDAAFSPDGTYLALRTDNSLSLLTIPEFELERSLTIPPPPTKPLDRPLMYLDWSADSRYVVTMTNTEIIVWDIIAEEIYETPINIEDGYYDQLKAMNNGWAVMIYRLDQPILFVTCNWDLTTCQSQEQISLEINTSSESPIPTQSHQWIANPVDLVLEDEFVSNSIVMIDNSIELTGTITFNQSNSHFLALKQNGKPGLWSFPELDFIPTLPETVTNPIWLADGQHVIVMNSNDYRTLQIYEIANETPIAELNINTYAEFGIDDYWYRYHDISADGSKIMLYMGWAVLIIPIEYN